MLCEMLMLGVDILGVDIVCKCVEIDGELGKGIKAGDIYKRIPNSRSTQSALSFSSKEKEWKKRIRENLQL